MRVARQVAALPLAGANWRGSDCVQSERSANNLDERVAISETKPEHDDKHIY